MKEPHSFETSVAIYPTTQHHISEELNIYQYHCENTESHGNSDCCVMLICPFYFSCRQQNDLRLQEHCSVIQWLI